MFMFWQNFNQQISVKDISEMSKAVMSGCASSFFVGVLKMYSVNRGKIKNQLNRVICIHKGT